MSEPTITALQERKSVAEYQASMLRAVDADPSSHIYWLCNHIGKLYAEIERLEGRCGLRPIGEDEAWCEICERCHGTGAIDTPFSGSDPGCPDCAGFGKMDQ